MHNININIKKKISSKLLNVPRITMQYLLAEILYIENIVYGNYFTLPQKEISNICEILKQTLVS